MKEERLHYLEINLSRQQDRDDYYVHDTRASQIQSTQQCQGQTPPSIMIIV